MFTFETSLEYILKNKNPLILIRTKSSYIAENLIIEDNYL